MTDRKTADGRARVLPLGGAVEVARSYLKVHVRDWWTGRCKGCDEPYPCRDRRDAQTVLGSVEPPSRPPGRRLVWFSVPILAGVVLIVLAALGFMS